LSEIIACKTMTKQKLLGLILVALFSSLVLNGFYDKFWLPHDEGAYAHVAQRMLQGEVLNRDIQDVHAGYINFTNAAALRLFGDDLLSLRYPLVVMTFLQSCLLYIVLLSRGVVVAMAGAIAMASLSFVQFLNPTANWYALFILVIIICCLQWIPLQTTGRIELIGFLVITLFLFRQLSGVFAGIGVMGYLFCESSRPDTSRHRLLSSGVILFLIGVLLWYLLSKTDTFATLAFGLCPLLLLAWAGYRASIPNKQALRLLLRLSVGGLLAAIPLFGYHLYHQSLSTWFADTVIAASALTELDFIHKIDYGMFVKAGLAQAAKSQNVSDLLNGVFWMILPLLALAHGLLMLRALFRAEDMTLARHPLPFLALFYALVSVHFQVSLYLFYSVPLTLCGILWLSTDRNKWYQYVPAVVTVGLAAIGLYYQAAQPVSRGEAGVIKGERIALTPSRDIRRCSLWIEPHDVQLYHHLISLIDRDVSPEESILALPVNPELYYLSGRQNPTRFFNAALGIQNQKQLDKVLHDLERAAPKLVFFRPGNPYNTSYTRQLMTYVKTRYELLESVSGFNIYRLTG
jgi:hypothetical protein